MCLWTARLAFLAAGYYFHLADVRRHHLEAAFFGLIVFGLGSIAAGETGKPQTKPEVSPIPIRTRLAVAGSGFVLALLLYYPTLGLGFLSDDYVLWNRAVTNQFITSTTEFFRPLPLLLWRAVAFIAVEPALTLHAVNILLHSANTFLVFCLSRAMGFSRWPAILCAATFLAWPTNVEPVAWCSGIQDVLMTTFVLAAMTAPLWKYPTGATAVLFLLLVTAAVTSKETAVISPLLFAVLWLGRSRQMFLFATLASVAAAGAIALRFRLGLPGDYLTPPSRYVFKELFSRLASGLATPMTSATLERLPQAGFGAVLMVSLLTAFAFWSWRTDRAAAGRAMRAALWAIVSILPVYRYFFIGPELEGSRYLYLGSFGWAVLLVQLVFSAVGTGRRTKAFATILAIVVIVTSALYSREQLRRWEAAAGLRDEVLRSARDAVGRSDCATASFEGLPDSLHGVYVFRNGFYEAAAIADRALAAKPRIRPEAVCLFVWRDGVFSREGGRD